MPTATHGSQYSYCVECQRARKREYWKTAKGRLRKDARKQNLRQYGLTEESYNIMAAKQGNVCAICGANQVWRKNTTRFNLAVDHDHRTGKVRGLLCQLCNTALGIFKDDPELVKIALAYLENGGVVYE